LTYFFKKTAKKFVILPCSSIFQDLVLYQFSICIGHGHLMIFWIMMKLDFVISIMVFSVFLPQIQIIKDLKHLFA